MRSRTGDFQGRKRYLAVSDVMIDMFDVLACRNLAGVSNDFAVSQLGNDEIALGVGIGIGGVSDLKRQLGQREPGVLGASSDPINAGVV